jgi:Putative porin
VQNGTNRLSNLPFINSREDRRLLRMRVRLGLDLRVSDDLTMGLRLATGNDSNPVSTNQTLGNDFNKYNFLLDRAFVRYTPLSTLTATLGRAPNPFATGVELVWDRDLSFDGLSLQWLQEKGRNQWRVAGGFFSVENTDPNYPGNGDVKFASRDKYLAGVQGEWSWQWTEKSSLRGSLGYFDFLNAAGQKSTKCTPLTTSDSCDTDVSRPRFVQKGNTMFGIRDLNVGNNDPVYQYYGLASDFRVLDAAASLDHKIGGPLHLALDADYARNLGFNQARVVAREPFNNFSPTGNGYAIGGEGFQVQARIGHPLIRQKGEWQTTLGYRYVESDAVMDAFTDSDFHLGGTNAKGYYVGGYYGFAQNASVGARYLSATEVSGPRLAIDLLQIDINVRY